MSNTVKDQRNREEVGQYLKDNNFTATFEFVDDFGCRTFFLRNQKGKPQGSVVVKYPLPWTVNYWQRKNGLKFSSADYHFHHRHLLPNAVVEYIEGF